MLALPLVERLSASSLRRTRSPIFKGSSSSIRLCLCDDSNLDTVPFDVKSFAGLPLARPPPQRRIACVDLSRPQRDQMAALISVAANRRAVLAPQVPLQLVDRRCLRSPNDIESNGLMSVTTEASNFQIAVTGIERIAQSRRWLRRSLKPSMRLFHASQASRSASRRASAARSAAARTEAL